jgi:hypothetical protein
MTASKPSTAPRTHGGSIPIPPEALLAPDPELHLAWADMAAWHEAHPSVELPNGDEEGDE